MDDETLEEPFSLTVHSHEEVAAIMTARGYPMGRRRVQQLEKAAIGKLKRSRVIREVARRMLLLDESET
jgi:hypothetical protein